MAHETLTRADQAAWQGNPIVTAADFWHLDQKGYRAINGDGGGTWAPAVVITIGGQGLTVTGQSRLNDVRTAVINAAGTLTANGVVTINALFDITGTGTLNVQAGASADFSGTVTFHDAVNFETGSVHIIEAAFTFDSTSFLTVDSGCEVDMTLGSGSLVTFESGSELRCEAGSTVTLAGANAISGATTLTGTITKSGSNGRIRQRYADLASNANHTIDQSQDLWFFQVTNTTSRTITLRRTTAPTPSEGDTTAIQVLLTATTGVFFINETTGEQITSIGATTPGGAAILSFGYHSGKWRCVGFSAVDITSMSIDPAF